MQTYHELLGVSQYATYKEIRSAYRRLALRWHPDKANCGMEQAEAMFKAVATAFEVLSNPATRNIYERNHCTTPSTSSSVARPWSGPVASAASSAPAAASAPAATSASSEPDVDPWDLFNRMFEGEDTKVLFRATLEELAQHGDAEAVTVSSVAEAVRSRLVAGRSHHCLRSEAEHAALVSRLQEESFCDDIEPPSEAVAWSEDELQRFFEHGGEWHPTAALAKAPSASPPPSITAAAEDDGACLVELAELVSLGGDTALGMVRRRDEAQLQRVAAALARDGWARLSFGAWQGADEGDEAVYWSRLHEEGRRAWQAGAMLECASPSGVPRSDLCVLVHDSRRLPGGAAAWPLAHELSDGLGAFLTALTGYLAASELGLVASAMSDAIWACFRKGAPGYGAHLDTCYDRPRAEGPRMITAILYTNDGWRAEYGGRLALWDQRERCWRTVRPEADTLVLFRSDVVWHRVEPVCERAPSGRFALTRFLFGSRRRRREGVRDFD